MLFISFMGHFQVNHYFTSSFRLLEPILGYRVGHYHMQATNSKRFSWCIETGRLPWGVAWIDFWRADDLGILDLMKGEKERRETETERERYRENLSKHDEQCADGEEDNQWRELSILAEDLGYVPASILQGHKVTINASLGSNSFL